MMFVEVLFWISWHIKPESTSSRDRGPVETRTGNKKKRRVLKELGEEQQMCWLRAEESKESRQAWGRSSPQREGEQVILSNRWQWKVGVCVTPCEASKIKDWNNDLLISQLLCVVSYVQVSCYFFNTTTLTTSSECSLYTYYTTTHF